MQFIVDTHLLIWAVTDSEKLSTAARKTLSRLNSTYFFSAASVWEIAIKRRKYPELMPLTSEDARNLFLEAGFRELTVASHHATFVEKLPEIHEDPFDRILIAQAIASSMKLVTHDKTIARYGDFVITV